MDSKGLRLIKEAYGGIYINQEEEIISESDCGCEHEKGKKDKKKEEIVAEEQLDENPILDKLRSGLKKIGVSGTSPALEREMGVDKETRRLGSNRMRQSEGDNTRPTPMKDDVDIFDIVKGHLMSEGYADTEEAALAIMANMSEEWRQSIVEMGLTPDQEQRRRNLSKAINKAGTPGNPGVNDPATRKMQGEYIQLQKLKGV